MQTQRTPPLLESTEAEEARLLKAVHLQAAPHGRVLQVSAAPTAWYLALNTRQPGSESRVLPPRPKEDVCRICSRHTEAGPEAVGGTFLQAKEGSERPQQFSTKFLGPSLKPSGQVRATGTTQATLWKEALPGASHPFSGRNHPKCCRLFASPGQLMHVLALPPTQEGKWKSPGETIRCACARGRGSPLQVGGGGDGRLGAKSPAHPGQRTPSSAPARKGCGPSAATRQRALLARRLPRRAQ